MTKTGEDLDPVHVLLRSIKHLLIASFIFITVIQAGLGITFTEQARAREHTITQLNQTIAAINVNTAATQQAAIDAKSAASKASTDLTEAIASFRNVPPDPRLVHAYAEIDCIAKGKEPCP